MPMRERIGLGGALAGKTFETFKSNAQPRAYQVATSFLGRPRTVVFSGPNGIGKTHLAAAIGNALIERDGTVPVRVCFITFQEVLRKLRGTYQEGYQGMGEEWWLDRWCNVAVLILDEVGQAGLEDRPSEFTRKIGYELVDSRYRAGNRPIVMTTNKTPAELGEWITESGVSRLYEMGDVVLMQGRDWRLRR